MSDMIEREIERLKRRIIWAKGAGEGGGLTSGISGVRPFACRIYYNLACSRHSCQNPTGAKMRLFDSVKRHIEKILGRIGGSYENDVGGET